MKIAIINITAGGMSGGYKKYLINIIPKIAQSPEVTSILCASPPNLNIQNLFETQLKIKFTHYNPFSFINNNSNLKKELKNFKPDVIFIPVERYMKFIDAPVVNMMQNMEPFIPINSNLPFIEKVKIVIQRYISKKSLKKSDHIIAISKSVSDFISSQQKISKDKISHIYYGVNNIEKTEFNKPDLIPDSWIGNFIFTAGSIRPYRGLEDIIYSINKIPESLIKGVVIAGESTRNLSKYHNNLLKIIDKLNIQSRICWTGNLNTNELNWCYSNCCIFVVTSRIESFCMIAGEAMSHGCICISTKNPCLPEVFGNGALYYESGNIDSLSETIKQCISWNESQKNEQSQKAKNQAQKFTWDICSERLVKTFKNVINNF